MEGMEYPTDGVVYRMHGIRIPVDVGILGPYRYEVQIQ